MIALDHWHFEVSSICSLRCPRCPRTEISQDLLNNQLDLNFFQTQIGEDIVKRWKKITFCGNDGDPIYCRDLIPICRWIKDANPETIIVIITNGSYRSTQWWQNLAKVLDQKDEIHWSIDGWDQISNSQYRINCDWTSIMNGIHEFKSYNTNSYRIWASIAFSFNENHLGAMRDMASKLEFDAFQLTRSTKFGLNYPEQFGNNDPLQPTDPQHIATQHRFHRDLQVMSTKIRHSNYLKQIFWQRAENLYNQQTFPALCYVGNKGVFVNSRGEFFPCCWTANRFEHNRVWLDLAQKKFNLYHRRCQDILTDPFWEDVFNKFDNYECRTKCGSKNLLDHDHVTEW